MSKRTDKFFPGWKMTPAQKQAYFRTLGSVYRAKGITSAADKEATRKQIHMAAFGSAISAKEINHTTMFDQFKAVCLAELQPTNLGAQLHQTEQPLIRLRFKIREMASEAYWRKIARNKFGTDDLDSLNEWQLTQLRNTLTARTAGEVEVPAESDPAGEEEFYPQPEMEGHPF
jgi:hypothetical protein